MLDVTESTQSAVMLYWKAFGLFLTLAYGIVVDDWQEERNTVPPCSQLLPGVRQLTIHRDLFFHVSNDS